MVSKLQVNLIWQNPDFKFRWYPFQTLNRFNEISKNTNELNSIDDVPYSIILFKNNNYIQHYNLSIDSDSFNLSISSAGISLLS